MSYSGNPSLPSEAKQRILTTFDQTLELAREGSRQEALLGCDFVLRMDPQFQPAQVLQDRLRSNAGPVQVDDLRGAGAASPQATQEVFDPFADLNADGLDLPDTLPDSSAAYLRDELQSLSDQRRFQDLMALAERERSAVAGDLELQRIVSAAQELMESEPYVLKFLNGAKQALQAHQADEAARLLEKARALDPGHPGLTTLARALGTAGAAVPPPAAAAAFGGAVGGDSESDRRIKELLDEGQRAFDAHDPQGAIDAWSRIFLIDIDHQEASRRIEMARRLKAESERQVEEVFHDGLGRLEAGDLEGARQAFQRVLEIQPGYFAAREYLQQLDAGIVPTPKPAPKAAHRDVSTAPPALSMPSEAELSGQELKEEILVPPEPGEQPAPAPERKGPKRTAAVREGQARRLFLLVGGAVLVIALVGGWFAWQNREQLFPNSQEQTPAGTLSQDPIARAQRLHNSGKTAIALNQLRRIASSDPHYGQAQKLIAEWGGGGAATETPPPTPAGTEETATTAGPETTPALSEPEQRRQVLLAAARKDYAERAFLQALRRLQRAGAIAKLEGDDAKLLADTRQQLAPIAKQIEFFQQHEWEYIMRDLYLMHESDPTNRDVTQLLVDCNYDLAVRDLQRNDATKAADWLKEAVKLQPSDELLQRQYLFAQTYQERPKDLLYRIYVKYLPYR